MDWLRKTGLTQWVLSGVLLAAGFLYTILWPIGILGITYFLHLSQRTVSYKKAALGGLIAWTIKSLAALVWFWSVYPLEWLAFSLGKGQLIIVAAYWLTAALWLGVGGMLVALAVRIIASQSTQKVLVAILIPLIWIVGELTGSLFFSFMTYGAGGAVTSAFSFGYVGYLLAQHDWLIQLAHLYGVYGLSFVAVLIAVGILWGAPTLARKKMYWAPLLFLLFWASASVPFFVAESVADEYYSVVTIDTAFPVNQLRTTEGEKEKQQHLEEAIQAALKLNLDYIVLPEDARYFNQSLPVHQEKNRFTFLHDNSQTIIVDSGRALVDGKTVLQAFVYNGLEDTVDISQKRYLVPQGEFMPYVYANILKYVGYHSAIEVIEKDISYNVGTLTSQSDAAKSTPGILYCFESVSPWGVKKIIEERGDVPFIAHPISHAWFHEPGFLWKHLDSMLRVQAIWNQQYIVSAGGHVAGQVYTPQGEILIPENIVAGDNWVVRKSFIPVLQ